MILNNVPIDATVMDIIQELRRQLSIRGSHLLKDVKDTPDNVMVTCPYHKGGKERRPSAGIKKSDGIFHCFTCGEIHSLQEVISYCFGQSDDLFGAFGWNWILKNFATIAVENRKSINLDLSRTPNREIIRCVPDSELDKYRVYHPYMWKRKMTPEIVDLFDVGYDDVTKSLTFPVRDISGNCLFVARRSVVSKFFNYPSGVEKPVYGLYELTLLDNYPDDVIICESMIDAITCWVYGKYAVALNGLGNELQIKQLAAMPCRHFILATDNDAAGRKAKNRLRSQLRRKIITEYVIPPGKKDINDLSKEEFLALQEVMV